MPLVILLLVLGADAPYPEGLVYMESLCASGGFDYYFFAGGVVVARCEGGCRKKAHVMLGSWRRVGADIDVQMKQEWLGEPQGRLVSYANVGTYEAYTAVSREVTPSDKGNDHRRLGPDVFNNTRLSCAEVDRHAAVPDPYSFLRTFDGDTPVTFRRLVEAADLDGKTLQELVLMRNEIFARYGYRFRNAELLAHFTKVKGYNPMLTDFDAFLSPVEKENVARVQAAEARAANAAAAGAAPATR